MPLFCRGAFARVRMCACVGDLLHKQVCQQHRGAPWCMAHICTHPGLQRAMHHGADYIHVTELKQCDAARHLHILPETGAPSASLALCERRVHPP